MFQQFVGNISATLTQMGDGAAEIDGIPMDDGTDHKIEPGDPERLTVKGAVADFTPLVEKDGALEFVRRFTFVETGLAAAQ